MHIEAIKASVKSLWSPCHPRYLIAFLCVCHALASAADFFPKGSTSADLFTNIHRLRLEVSAESWSALQKNAREYVSATLFDGATKFEKVAVHLKGSSGSFRPLESKPALTLDFAHFDAAERFHGLRRIHLNNSVEDPSCLNEYIGAEFFHRAGLPAPRVGHATLELNGRPLGLYVLKEAFTEDFLALHFKAPSGTLYEPGPGHDINEKLSAKLGSGAKNQNELRAFAEAALEPDAKRRWHWLGKALEVRQFARFMALEVILNHRDGYCMARNNFRLYEDSGSGLFYFFPTGMDQLFAKADAQVFPQMSGLAAKALMETREGLALYKGELFGMVTNVFDLAYFEKLMDRRVAQLKAVLTESEAKGLLAEAAETKQRLEQRYAFLQQRLISVRLQEPRFNNGTASLTNWVIARITRQGDLDITTGPDGARALHILAERGTATAWRAELRLPQGRYRFSASVATKAVAMQTPVKNWGARLRAIGEGATRPISRDTPWTELGVDLQVTDIEKLIHFQCELRADKGEAWFRLDTLKITKLGD
ncbi:MAG TPA: CotH kinase family protein [Verrucomicrobiae bacterium]